VAKCWFENSEKFIVNRHQIAMFEDGKTMQCYMVKKACLTFWQQAIEWLRTRFLMQTLQSSSGANQTEKQKIPAKTDTPI